MKIDESKRNQVYVIEKTGQAVHLGGCNNPNQAARLVNTAVNEGKVTEPEFALVVPSHRVIPCALETTIRFAHAHKLLKTPMNSENRL
jgi:hypothetical protein